MTGGLPFGVVFLVVLVLPCCLAVLLGLFAWKDRAPLVFRCSRCGGDFQRKSWKRFPRRCSICRARDWNAPQ